MKSGQKRQPPIRTSRQRKPVEKTVDQVVDFSGHDHTKFIKTFSRLRYGGLHVVHAGFPSHPGGLLSSPQFAVVVHKGKPFDLEYCLPESDRLEIKRIEFGDASVNRSNNPIFHRWQASPTALVMAFECELIDRVGRETCGRDSTSLKPLIGIKDERLARAARTWREELELGGATGRLFSEHLAVVVAVHLYASYSDENWRAPPVKGGLGSFRLRQVTDYIAGHLGEDLSVATLADIAGLSLHHFSSAFRESTGTPPHRYVLINRLERAKVLLRATDLSITEVALEVGFANHSHFTSQFRDHIGVTPMQFRSTR